MSDPSNKPVYLVDAYADPVMVRLEGRACHANCACLQDFIAQMISQGKTRFVMDFAGCASMDSTFLGVRAVVAQSFERIHRSNLVGMGVLPLQFKEGTTAQTLQLDGTETYSVEGLGSDLRPQQDLTLCITGRNGGVSNVPVRCRIDTPIEIDYYQHGGILPYVLRQIVTKS